MKSWAAFRVIWMAAVYAAVLMTCALSSQAAGTRQPFVIDEKFDHSATRFPLQGAHIAVTCEKCHVGGKFAGTPRACFACHDGKFASGKSRTHPPTTNQCQDCHNSSRWREVKVDHSKITTNCFSCHEGRIATGKVKNHIPSGNGCEDCHAVSTWSVPRFDHSETTLPCATCHDGRKASGKSRGHLPSGPDCASCHGTRNWTQTHFSHDGITGACFSCHNGRTATGKSRAHLPTTNDCESCHTSFISWSSGHFDHSQALGTCVGCHDNRHSTSFGTITGKSRGHFRTSDDCAACHSTNAWSPARFDHAEGFGTCYSCHDGLHPPAVGKGRGHIPSPNTCEDCHNTITWDVR